MGDFEIVTEETFYSFGCVLGVMKGLLLTKLVKGVQQVKLTSYWLAI